eukprot:m.278696 g.278696  ORF g.278696 m.278696 type:complete len:699 (+) comp16318_c0_seq1:2-2098(+)
MLVDDNEGYESFIDSKSTSGGGMTRSWSIVSLNEGPSPSKLSSLRGSSGEVDVKREVSPKKSAEIDSSAESPVNKESKDNQADGGKGVLPSQKVSISKPLGLSFHGSERFGYYVVKVRDDGNAKSTGKVSVGQRIASVNGKEVSDMAKAQVTQLIKASGDPVELILLEDGFGSVVCENISVREELLELQKSNATNITKVEDLQCKVEDVNKSENELRRQLKESHEVIQVKNASIKEMTSQISGLESKIIQMVAWKPEIENLKSELVGATKEKQELKSDLENVKLESENLWADYESVKKELDDALHRAGASDKRNTELDAQIQALNQSLSNMELKYEPEMQKLKAEIKTLKTRAEDAQGSVSSDSVASLQERLRERTEAYDSMSKQNDELENRIVELEKELRLKSLTHDTKIKQSSSPVEDSVRLLKSSLAEHQGTISDMISEKEALQWDNEALQESINEYEREKKALQESVNDLTQKVTNLEKELALGVKKVPTMPPRDYEGSEEVNEMVVEKNDDSIALKSENTALKAEVLKLSATMQELSEKLRGDKEGKEATISKLQEQNASLEKEMAALKSENATMMVSHQGELDRLRALQTKLERQIADWHEANGNVRKSVEKERNLHRSFVSSVQDRQKISKTATSTPFTNRKRSNASSSRQNVSYISKTPEPNTSNEARRKSVAKIAASTARTQMRLAGIL